MDCKASFTRYSRMKAPKNCELLLLLEFSNIAFLELFFPPVFIILVILQVSSLTLRFSIYSKKYLLVPLKHHQRCEPQTSGKCRHFTRTSLRYNSRFFMGLGDSSKPVFCRLQGKRANLNTEIRKQSLPNFPKNEHFLPPGTHTYVCVSEGKKCSFFGKFGLLCFLVTPF